VEKIMAGVPVSELRTEPPPVPAAPPAAAAEPAAPVVEPPPKPGLAFGGA
jgi:cell division protease FtsH